MESSKALPKSPQERPGSAGSSWRVRLAQSWFGAGAALALPESSSVSQVILLRSGGLWEKKGMLVPSSASREQDAVAQASALPLPVHRNRKQGVPSAWLWALSGHRCAPAVWAWADAKGDIREN